MFVVAVFFLSEESFYKFLSTEDKNNNIKALKMSDNLNKIHAKNEEKTSTQTSIATAIQIQLVWFFSFLFFLQNRTEKKEGANVHLVLCKF